MLGEKKNKKQNQEYFKSHKDQEIVIYATAKPLDTCKFLKTMC